MPIKHLYICLFFIAVFIWAPCYGDWESEANARIEQIRKRNVEITVVDSEGYPVPGLGVQMEQIEQHFAFGTCISYFPLVYSGTYRNFILNHFNWAVCENETKWPSNESTRDNENYTQADYIYNWCNSNGIKMRGHCLFWEQVSQVQSWVQSLPYATYPTSSQLLDEVDERIDSAVNHYKNKFYNWDIDNEMLANSFYDRLGEAGRVHMFERTKLRDPNCGAFMNEYSGNSFGGYNSWPYVTRASNLISLGAPIDGFGIQGHLDTGVFNPESYYNNVLQPLATLGRPIWVTEFDAPHSDENISADNIEDFFRICFSHPNVEAIMMWGFMQNQMWRENAYLITSGGTLTARGERYEDLMDEWTTNDINATDFNGVAGFRGFHGTHEITLSAPGQTSEIYTIELEPGETTALFEIETDLEPPPEDATPPEPDPMTWAALPAATGMTSITMTATTATDVNTPPVRYYFECVSDGNKSSGWQTSDTIYEATGLEPNTLYSFRVKARDSAPLHNETGWSSTQSATTDAPDITPPTPDPMTWASVPVATGSSTIVMTATTATDSEYPPVQYYFECTNYGSKSSGWQSSPTYVASGLTPNRLYSFRVKARDSFVPPNETGWSSTLSATTGPANKDVEIIGSWEMGTTHTKESGTDRALVFIAYAEHSGAIDLTSVTYGGQLMDLVIDEVVGTSSRAYVAAYILDKAGIEAATNDTFVPTWNTTPDDVGYTSVFLQDVNQIAPIGDFDSNGSASSTPNPITTDALSTDDGDMVFDAATCGNTGAYTLQNGFLEVFEHDMDSSTGTNGYKSATGVDETPSAMHNNVNYQVIIGFVIQAAILSEYQNCADVQAGGYALESDLTGDCYVDYSDIDALADYWLHTDCSEYSDCEGADFAPTDDVVDLFDFGDFALQWLWCNDPEDLSCTPNW